MSDTDTPRKPYPTRLRRLVLPWWKARGARLADLLATALETGSPVLFEAAGARFWLTADQIAELATVTADMLDRLEAEEAADE